MRDRQARKRRERADPWAAFVDHVQTTPARLTPSARREIFAAATTPEDGGSPLTNFATQVAERSYRITEDDIAELRHAGHTDDEIFETIIVAATAAADRRQRAARRTLSWD